MKISRKITGILVVIFMFTFCACSSQEVPAPTLDPTLAVISTPTPTPSPSPTPIPTTTPEPTPTFIRSYTTGVILEEQGIYKPVGVIIENSKAARSQTGLQAADIVYEAPVEGITRFFCIYNDTIPEIAGPVRSARIYFVKIQQEWDCAFAHFGGPENGEASVYRASSDHIKTRINFIKGFNDYYFRSNKKSAPHNAFAYMQKCQELMEEEARVHTFKYDENTAYTGQDISEIILPFYAGEVTYRYDAERNLLIRYMSGKEFKDALTDKAVEVQNLIVQYNNFYHGNELKGRWLCDQLGSGKADFFIGGKHIEGTWEREDFESFTIYKDLSGNEIVLLPGNTWIAVHPDDEEITITF